MKSFQYGKKQKLLWGLFLLAAWGTVILIFMRHNGGLTAKELALYKPAHPLLSCLVMLGLYTLKSVDFLIHSGVLYAADGIMFPLPTALLINLIGIVITVTPTYYLGKIWGPPVIEALLRRYPKMHVFTEGPVGGSVAVAVLLRTVGLPIQAGSLYMGASHFGFGHFLIGSVLGLVPVMIPYTVLGESIGTPGSPAFIIALGTEIVLHVASVITLALMAKRRAADKTVTADQ